MGDLELLQHLVAVRQGEAPPHCGKLLAKDERADQDGPVRGEQEQPLAGQAGQVVRVYTWPRKRRWPWSGAISPAMMRSSVLFPEPFRPTSAVTTPRSACSVAAESTFRSPNRLPMESALRMGSAVTLTRRTRR
ncbi:MAG TPA: hypothetical protein VGB24_03090 [Longimicrobium sp.]